MRSEVPFVPIVVCLLMFVGLLAGCRTYGGYGSEKAAIEETVQAVDNYADLLARARTVLDGLREAEGETPEMVSVADRFEVLVTAHAILLEKHREQVAGLTGSSDFRRISRVFGAIMAEQKLTQRQYTEVLEGGLTAPGERPELVHADVTPLGRYYVIPPYYERVRRAPVGSLPRWEIGVQSNTAQPDTTRPDTMR